MPRQFFRTTAELTIRVVEAVHSSTGSPDVAFIETFCDLPNAQAMEALGLASDIGLISEAAGKYSVLSALTPFFSTPKDQQKASLLRIALESYDVFLIFRERLFATDSADNASQQTKALLDLTNHREEIKDTLISLGTFSGAIATSGGGQFKREQADITEHLMSISSGCANAASAESWVRDRLGAAADNVDRADVLIPLSNAIIKALDQKTSDAVTEAGTAFESFLVNLASKMSVSLAGASGINQKLDKFRTDDKLPKAIVQASKYIGQVRNAAGHGKDPDIDANWKIQSSTGIEMVCVVCSMIRACHERESGGSFIL